MNIYKNINPVLEVVHYFNRRINGSSISDTMLQLEHTYSDRQEEIHPLISRIIQIEFLLNSELMADFDRLSFFFRRLDGPLMMTASTFYLLPSCCWTQCITIFRGWMGSGPAWQKSHKTRSDAKSALRCPAMAFLLRMCLTWTH